MRRAREISTPHMHEEGCFVVASKQNNKDILTLLRLCYDHDTRKRGAVPSLRRKRSGIGTAIQKWGICEISNKPGDVAGCLVGDGSASPPAVLKPLQLA